MSWSGRTAIQWQHLNYKGCFRSRLLNRLALGQSQDNLCSVRAILCSINTGADILYRVETAT